MVTGVERWTSCKFSLISGLNNEEGYELRDTGLIETFGCEHPSVVSNSHQIIDIMEKNKTFTKIAVLKTNRTIEDVETKTALQSACGECPYYTKERNKKLA